jgi:hypothetical protein
MELQEVKSFWRDWLFEQQATRIDEPAFFSILDKGNQAIESDVEFWQRQSMWRLFDAVKN